MDNCWHCGCYNQWHGGMCYGCFIAFHGLEQTQKVAAEKLNKDTQKGEEN